MGLIIKSNIKKVVKELQGKEEDVTSVGEEVGAVLERRVEELLDRAIKRARENKRRTLQGRDL